MHISKMELVLLFACCVAFGLIQAATAPAVVGDWQGSLDTGGGSLKIVIHISVGKNDNLTGTLDSPDQGVTRIGIKSVHFEAPAVDLDIPMIRGSFEGKLNANKSEIAGQWKQGEISLPLTLRRLVPAKTP